MGEETTWFNFIPGLNNLEKMLGHTLGREEGQGMFFRWQLFQDSAFTMAHVYGALLVFGFVTFGALTYRRAVAGGGDGAVVPPERFDLRNLFEMFTEAVMSVAEGVMGRDNARLYLPLLGTLAIFIFFSNALALIPGFIPPTSTLKTNAALAVSVFFLTHAFGVREHGLAYFKHFLGPIPWLIPLMLPIELVSHIARPISLSLRLLGNMAADHKVASVFFVLVPLLLPVPLLVLGVLVAIVQTLVFTLLTMVYIQGAVAHEEH